MKDKKTELTKEAGGGGVRLHIINISLIFLKYKIYQNLKPSAGICQEKNFLRVCRFIIRQR